MLKKFVEEKEPKTFKKHSYCLQDLFRTDRSIGMACDINEWACCATIVVQTILIQMSESMFQVFVSASFNSGKNSILVGWAA